MPIDTTVSELFLVTETVTGVHVLAAGCLLITLCSLGSVFWVYRHHKRLQQRFFQLMQERDYLQAIIESNRHGLFSLQNQPISLDILDPFWQRWARLVKKHTSFWEKCKLLLGKTQTMRQPSVLTPGTGEKLSGTPMTHFRGAMTNGNFARLIGVAGTWSHVATGYESEGHHLQGYERLRVNLNRADCQKLDAALSQLCNMGHDFDLQVTLENPPRLLNISGYQLLRTSEEEGTTKKDVLGCALWVQDQSAQANQDFVRLEMVQARQEATQLRAILDALPFPVWRRDMHLDVVDGNQAYKRFLETDLPLRRGPFPELLRGPLERVGVNIAERAMALMQFKEQTHHTVTEEHHLVVDGARLLFAFSERAISPLLANDQVRRENMQDMHFGMGHATVVREGSVGWALDLTSQETAQRDLQRHMRSHQQTLQNLTIPIEIYGADQRLRFYNDAYAKLWSLEHDWLNTNPKMTEVLEQMRSLRKLPEVANFPAFKEMRQRLFTVLTETQTDLIHLPDGTTLRMIVAPHPLGGLILTYEDVTDRLALQRSYNELIDVQRETLDQLYEGIAVFGGDGRLKLCNPSYLRLWQLDMEQLGEEPHVSEIIQQTRQFFDPVGAWEDYHNWMINLIADPKPETGRLERNEGTILEYSCVALPDGGVLFTYLDITRSSQSERYLQQKMESFELSRQLRSAYLQAVLSNMMTPLHKISGFADILVNSYAGALNDQQVEFAHSIRQTAHFVSETLHEILMQKDLLSEIDHMQLDDLYAQITVDALVSDVRALCREDLRRSEIKIVYQCADSLKTAHISASYMKQALFALFQEVSQSVLFGKLSEDMSAHEISINVTAISETCLNMEITCPLPQYSEEYGFGGEDNRLESSDHGLSPAYILLAKLARYHKGEITQQMLEHQRQKISLSVPIIALDKTYSPIPGYELMPSKVQQ